MDGQLREHVFLSGRVQGVGMRATVAALAEYHGLTGWVMNLSDGRVELVVEGPPEVIERMLNALERQMGRYIETMNRNTETVTGSCSGFGVRY